jgi:hypothetical protein
LPRQRYRHTIVALTEPVKHRTQPLRVAIKAPVQDTKMTSTARGISTSAVECSPDGDHRVTVAGGMIAG